VIWIPITLAGACFQTFRTAKQQKLRALMSVNGAGFVRYLYGAPVGLAAVGVLAATGHDLPSIPWRFWPFVTGSGVAQVFGTVFLIRAFDARNYAIGTVYSKTEVVQVALFSTVLLGEPLPLLGWLAVAICFSGVVVLAGGLPLGKLADRAARFGMAAGGLFALASVGIRASSQSLGDHPAFTRAIVTLAAMNTIQTVVQGAQVALREREQLRLAFTTWRSSAVVGLLSVGGTACWSWAFSLQNAARVRTLGQVELLITFVVARLWLGERHTKREIAASVLVLLGALGVIAS
jgi:drug/metabolite transporter (DMT)-like permease